MANILKLGGAIGLGRLAAAPANPENGWMYYDTTLNKLQQYVNGGWEDVAAGEVSPEFSTDDFRLQNGGDPTKQTAFNNDDVSPGETRTIRVPDRDLYLDNYLPAGTARTATIENLTDLEGLLTVDGYELQDGDTVLVKDQSDPTENGLYFARVGAWERMDRLKLGDVIQVEEGQSNRGCYFFAKLPFPTANYGVDEIYFDLLSFNPYSVASGLGANVYADENVPVLEGFLEIDGYTLGDGDTVLLGRQDDETENGAWFVRSGAWERATGYLQNHIMKVFGEGKKYRNSTFRIGSNSPVGPVIRFGVDNIFVDPVANDPEVVLGRMGARVVTFDNQALTGLPTIDGVELEDGNQILLCEQTDQTENGIWRVSAGAWERATDYHRGSIIHIFDGDNHSKETFIIDSNSNNGNLIRFGSDEIYPNRIASNPNTEYLKLDGSSEMQGFLNMGNNRINFLADPVDGDEAATKQYVDSADSDLQDQINEKSDIQSGTANVATTEDIPVLEGLLEIDNYQTVDGNLILVKDQNDPTQNGVYVARVGAWEPINNLSGGDIFYIYSGDQTGSLFVAYGPQGHVDIGTDDVRFAKTSQGADLSGVIHADGSVPMAADLDMGNNKIISVATPTNDTDAANKEYVDDQIAAIPDPLVYQGTWSAATNTPTLSNAGAAAATGHLYQVNAAGSVDFGAGAISFEIGDKVVSNGTVWEKWDMTDAVTSVNGQNGVVVLDTDDISEGATNKYFSDAAAQAAVISQVITNGVTDKAPSEDAVFDALATKLSNVIEDTTPELGGDLDVLARAIQSSTSEVVLAGQNAVRRAKAASKADFIEEEYIHAIALSASQTNTVIAALTVAHATVEGLEIEYKVKEATSNDVRIGRLRVVTNGTDIAFFDDAVETNDTGVTFDAVINGANINVRYSSGSNAATMRADVKKIKA